MKLRSDLLLRNCFEILPSGTIGKAISVAMMPFYIGGYWTIPILPINKELYKQKWNKPLAMIQSFLIPIVVSLLRNSVDVKNSNFVVEQKIKYHWPRKIYYSDNERILASSFKMIIVIRREMVDHEK